MPTVKIHFQRRWQDHTTAERIEWPCRPTIIPGLVVTRPVALDAQDNPIEDTTGWHIIHVLTGQTIGPRFRTLGDVADFLNQLEARNLDWTVDPRENWEPYRVALLNAKELMK